MKVPAAWSYWSKAPAVEAETTMLPFGPVEIPTGPLRNCVVGNGLLLSTAIVGVNASSANPHV